MLKTLHNLNMQRQVSWSSSSNTAAASLIGTHPTLSQWSVEIQNLKDRHPEDLLILLDVINTNLPQAVEPLKLILQYMNQVASADRKLLRALQ